MQLKRFCFVLCVKTCKAQSPQPDANGYFLSFYLFIFCQQGTSDRFYNNCKGFSLFYEITYLGSFWQLYLFFLDPLKRDIQNTNHVFSIFKTALIIKASQWSLTVVKSSATAEKTCQTVTMTATTKI